MTAAEHADLILERVIMERVASALERRAISLAEAAERAGGAEAEIKRRNARGWWACAVELRREMAATAPVPAASMGIAAE